jgi:hypothetical protein
VLLEAPEDEVINLLLVLVLPLCFHLLIVVGVHGTFETCINFFLLGLPSVLSLMFALINLVVPPAVRPPLVRLLLPLSQCTASSGDRITPTPPFAPWVVFFFWPMANEELVQW